MSLSLSSFVHKHSENQGQQGEALLGSTCQGLEPKIAHSLSFGKLPALRVSLLLTSRCYLNECHQRFGVTQSWPSQPAWVPGKEPFLSQSCQQGWGMRVGAKCSEPRYHHRPCLPAEDVLFIFHWVGLNDSLLLSHHFPEAEWWAWEGLLFIQHLFLRFPGSLLFWGARISVLSACGHNIQDINTH